MKFELNADAPGQHMVILVLAGVFIFLSVVESVKSPDKEDATVVAKGPYELTGETLYENPEMAWYERLLCRGYQRSGFCSYRLLHPFKSVFDENGIHVDERPPQKGVIRYKGPLPGHKTWGGRVVFED